MTIENNGTPAGRTAAEIEAELESIDVTARELLLEDTVGEQKPAAKQEVHDYEYEARRKGWRPEPEYTGPEGKWVDAQTFVERGERFTKKLQGEIETLQRKIDSFEGTKAQFRKFFDEQMAKRDKEHAEAIQTLRLQHKAAIRDGDDELALELEDRIDTTRKQQASLKEEAAAAAADKAEETPAATAPTTDPVLVEWIAEGNEWFQTDEVLTKHAIAVGKQFRANGEKAIGRAFLEMVAAQVKSDFPRRFKALQTPSGSRNVSTEGAGQGGTGNPNSGGYNGKTERDLPAEDLALMRQFIKDGLYTKEQFLKSYFSRNS
jgi:P2-related tail formation protein